MIKDKIDFKLINTALIMVIIFLLYKTGSLWIGILGKLLSVSFPFFIGFVFAYALYPFEQFLEKHKIPKGLSITIIIAIVITILLIASITIVPIVVGELPNLFNEIIFFIKQTSNELDINSISFQASLSDIFNNITNNLSAYVSKGAINVVSSSIGILSTFLISSTAAIYFLVDMDKIRKDIKKYLRKKSKKMYSYIALLDEELKKYLSGFIRIICIAFVEYSAVYFIIGHPYALLLGFLAMIANFIPYFGGIVTNIIAAITAFIISPALFIKTVITFVILSSIDGYVINPLVYGKTNKLHPLVVIMSVFVGGSLFGMVGILFSLPLAIILISTIKYFRSDINEKIEDIKNKMEEQDK